MNILVIYITNKTKLTEVSCKKMGKNFYISDTHFGHQNVIKFDSRPFSSTEEMEEVIVGNWNKVVSKEDTVYILGDFVWGKNESEWIRILDRLMGSKILIMGNHDLKNMSTELKAKFAGIARYKEITDNGKHVIMSHYPILLHKAAYNPDCYMLCGHVHITREDSFLEKWRQELRDTWTKSGDAYGNVINVGCMKDYMNYTPKTLEELIKGAK